MAISLQDLLDRALAVYNEQVEYMNSNVRIGSLLRDIVSFLETKADKEGTKVLSDNNYSNSDKANLTTLVNLLSNNTDNVIDTISEVFKVLESYPEGVKVVDLLGGKVDKGGYTGTAMELNEKIELLRNRSNNSFSEKQIREVFEDGFYICDTGGNCAFGINAMGAMSCVNGNVSSFPEIAEKGFAIADAKGNTAFKVDKKGNTEFKISKKFAARLKEMLENTQPDLPDINHIITYGQSLGEGSQCSPIITSTPFAANALMFNHGIKTRYATEPKYQSFIPHIEIQNEENGETPAAGTAQKFMLGYDLDDREVLSSCCARGAMTVAQLSKGTTWYNNMVADVTNAKRLADAAGKTYRLVAVTWTQGEYDYGNGVEYYKNKLRQLRSDFIADIEAITGEDYSGLPFITYQVSSSYTAGKSYPDIGIALLELGVEADNGFYMATPIYHLQYADGWHLKNTSSKWLGAYYGLVLDEVISGNDWKPLYPTSHSVVGNVVSLKFNKGGLVFEKPQYLTAAIPNRGFSIKNGGGAEIIQSVEIASDDTISVTCSESPVGLSVNYGFSNINNRNAGELRDSSEEKMTISGTDFPLYNWCSIFEYKL